MVMVKKLNIILLFIVAVFADNVPAPPDIPEVKAVYEHEQIKLIWDKVAQNSIDPLTGYVDFEGYRIYKSTDGGKTWGKSWQRKYDYAGN